jgi:hypothetical protein
MRSRTHLLLVIAGAAVASGSVALATGSSTPRSLVPDDRPIKATVPAASSQATQAFSLLGRAQAAGDRLHGAPNPGQFDVHGANPALARRAVDSPDDPIYMVPGNGDLCLVHGYDMASVCGSLAAAQAGEVVSWGPCLPGLTAGQVSVSGFVPDAVQTVTLTLGDGSEMAHPVRDNAYQFVTPSATALPTAVEFRSEGTAHTVPTPIQASDLPASC